MTERGIRIVKHIGSRSCPADDAKALVVIPTFPGESVLDVKISAYFASGDDSSIDQPSELNWYGISIPWSLAFSTQMMQGTAPDDLSQVSDFDTLYERWVRSAAVSADHYWGGDVDADPEDMAGEEGAGDEELIDSGPIGVFTWFSREVVMQPYAAEGNNVIRFGDGYYASTGKVPIAAMGSLLILGVMRSEHAAETNFNVELDDSTSIQGMGLLLAGDYPRVMAKVEGDTSSLGDYLRTVLYGGDAYIEADTLKGAAGKATVKVKAVVKTSLARIR